MSIYRKIYPWQTRLLKVKSTPDPATDLELELVTVDLVDLKQGALLGHTDIVEYVALSYAWGTDHPSVPCLCHGSRVMLRKSLASALKYCRRPDTDRYIWVDFLCIDQQNEEEKEFQIQRMMNIYSKASKVLAWLDHMPSLDSIVQVCSESCDGNSPTEFGIAICQVHLQEFLTLVMQSSWFRRGWVRQEVYAATTLYVACPQFSIPWETLSTAIIEGKGQPKPSKQHAQDKSRVCKGDFSEAPYYRNLVSLDCYFRRSSDHSGWGAQEHAYYRCHQEVNQEVVALMELLKNGAGFETSIPSDQIFSLLGMVQLHKSSRAIVPISYSKPYEELCGDIIRYIIRTARNINILRLCILQRDKTYMLNWPRLNWVGFDLQQDIRRNPVAGRANTTLDWFDSLNPIGQKSTNWDARTSSVRPLYLYGRLWGTLSIETLRMEKDYWIEMDTVAKGRTHHPLDPDLSNLAPRNGKHRVFVPKHVPVQTRLHPREVGTGVFVEREGIVCWAIDHAQAGDLFVELEPGPYHVVLRRHGPHKDDMFHIVGFGDPLRARDILIRGETCREIEVPTKYFAWVTIPWEWGYGLERGPPGERQVYAII